MSRKLALIIGNTEYTDPGLAQLTAPGRDAEDLARVIRDQDICAFDDVSVLVNENASVAREAIDDFFARKRPDDLLVLYFSGHGVRDEFGSLYLAMKNTNRDRLRSTAINSSFIREGMDQSRSRRQVLILDCCNSGAFAQGTKAEAGGSVGTATAFEGTGYGRVVLTASDTTQFAWEGDKVIGETENSLFTHFLVKGLEGEADRDGDGRITIDELYDYAYEQIVNITPKQTPGKWSYKQQGEIVLRQNVRIEDTQPISLPEDLMGAINSSLPYIREGAVRQLEHLLNGRNLRLARSARLALEKIVEEDDSRRVSRLAADVLAPVPVAEQKAEEERKAREEADHIATLKAREERLAQEKAVAEREAKNHKKQPVAVPAAEKPLVSNQPGADRFAEQNAEEIPIAYKKVEHKGRENINPLTQMAMVIQKRLGSFKFAFPSKVKLKYWVMGLGALFVVLLLFIPQLAYSSAKSIEQNEGTGPAGESVRIMNNIDYSSRRFLLNGLLLDIEVNTDDLKDQLCQVVVYFEHSDDLVTTSKSLTTFLSPYISDGSYVSAFANFTPEYQNTKTNIKLFIPYAAFANSELPDGAVIRFFADLYTVENRTLLARSSQTQFFKYTK